MFRPNLDGLTFRLRPVEPADAAYIVEIRGKESKKLKYLNPIADDVAAQERWIEKQQADENDHYFVIEDRFTGKQVGLVGLYDIADARAEWGRWIVEDGSLAAIESVHILMKFAFDELRLNEVYSRTVSDNTSVVQFHESYAQRREQSAPLTLELRGQTVELIEHFITPQDFEDRVGPKWDRFCQMIFNSRLVEALGKFEFHHLGVATKSIKRAAESYRVLGYAPEARFTDPEQGVHGLFMTARGQPRIELLENMEGSKVLDSWLTHSISIYHSAYFVTDLTKALGVLEKLGIRQINPIKTSAYFGVPIVFCVMPNHFIIELIEEAAK